MLNLILFILICFGLTNIVVYGSIFDKIKLKENIYFKKLFNCCMCMGFWVGIIVFLCFWFYYVKLFGNVYIGCFLFGCLSSGISSFLCSIFDDFGLKIVIKTEKKE